MASVERKDETERTTSAGDSHPVLEAIRNPKETDRLALVIEGGGMRGAVSGGMGLALHGLGLTDRFDAAYGSSAGSLNAIWLISGRAEEGIATWTDPELADDLVSKRRLFSRRPIVDMETLIGRHYERISPGLFEAVLDAKTELHPLATDVESGQTVDLHRQITDRDSLIMALRSSSTLPMIGGPPIEFAGGRYLDAGLSSAIPFQAAIDDGATHILVLRSRRSGDVATDPAGFGGKLTTRMLGRISPAVQEGYLTRGRREGADEAFLDLPHNQPGSSPNILSVRPGPDSPVPSRLESDLGLVRAGLEAGHHALLELFKQRD